MKFLIIAFSFFLLGLHVDASVKYIEYADLLSKYVRSDGVDYASWSQVPSDIKRLDSVLADWSQVDVESLTQADQKAFYINLYNAAMLQAVFDNYPLKSVKNIGLLPFSIFKKKFIKQGTQKLSLDGVEKGILLKEFVDPRIHFAVNCASESCPPLRAEPFLGEVLDSQLDEQTRDFAESNRAIRINQSAKSIAYSELFKWYKGDFEVENPAEYLNNYRSKKVKLSYKVKWIEYDWSLNSSSN